MNANSETTTRDWVRRFDADVDPRTDSFKRELGYRVQPHLFLVDEDGTVIHQWLGYVEAEELEAAFNEALH